MTSADHSSENMTVWVLAWSAGSLFGGFLLCFPVFHKQVTKVEIFQKYCIPIPLKPMLLWFFCFCFFTCYKLRSTCCVAVHTNAHRCSDQLYPLIVGVRISSSVCLHLKRGNSYYLGDLWVPLGPKGRDVAFDTEKPFRIS